MKSKEFSWMDSLIVIIKDACLNAKAKHCLKPLKKEMEGDEVLSTS